MRGDAVACARARQHLLIRRPPALSRFKYKWKAHGPAGALLLEWVKRFSLERSAFFVFVAGAGGRR